MWAHWALQDKQLDVYIKTAWKIISYSSHRIVFLGTLSIDLRWQVPRTRMLAHTHTHTLPALTHMTHTYTHAHWLILADWAGTLGRTAQDGHLNSHTSPELWTYMLSCCLTSTEARWPIRDGDIGESERLECGNCLKKTGETVDRHQNNGSVKVVSPRHCPVTCALRNCCFNCCTGQSH